MADNNKGVTEVGFKRPNYSEVRGEMDNRAKELFGDDANTSDKGVLGILNGLFGWFLAKIWEVAERVYNSAYVSKADGVSLDRLGNNIGITRQSEQHAYVTLTITGDPNTDVPSGFLVQTDSGILFETTYDVTIGSGGTVTVEASADQPGISGNVGSGMLTVITTPLTGVTAVTNAEPAQNGRNYETDEEFRSRYEKSLAQGGASTLEALRASVLDLPGVQTVLIEENDTMTELNSVPPKSFATFVFGGIDEDIAQTIYDTKPAGIRAFGAITTNIVDSMGSVHTIGFDRPDTVEVYVDVTLVTNEFFPADGFAKVETNIIKYIGGTDADGNGYLGLGLSDDVILTRIVAAAHQVDGIEDVIVKLGTAPDPTGTTNIAITSRQVAKTDATKVTVS
ncbi:baseplate J/gp47 family protein [Exiguobacterium sp. s5]|uniref:baseplate J/gp47 family protein n=1 Tax=Exiguobacterium sp. s5 TaxID=2751239 RepID=UPI001BEAC659|nr:baseplate J/gp47 family protein [Exiguobacterium sp. s5]